MSNADEPTTARDWVWIAAGSEMVLGPALAIAPWLIVLAWLGGSTPTLSPPSFRAQPRNLKTQLLPSTLNLSKGVPFSVK